MSFTDNLDGLLDTFSSQARLLDVRISAEIPLQEVREDPEWEWSEKVGVYYFRNDPSGILYVGRALPGTKFGNRIWSHLRATDEKWVQDIAHESAVLGLIPVPEGSWYLASALELFLIDSLEPRHNAKRG